MKTVNEDPILSIRIAISEGMRSVMRDPDKEFVDAIIDALPDFFRQPLTAAEPNKGIHNLLTASILQDKIDDLENVVQMLRCLKKEAALN